MAILRLKNDIFALFCKKGGYRIAEDVREYYLPIFEGMTKREYYSNGRTARTVYEKTVSNLKRRVIYTDDITEEEAKTILRCDLLSEEECNTIVSIE